MTDTAEIFQFPTPPEAPREKRGPQVEDGYTRIANELFEAVTNAQTCPVTLRQMRVVLAVIRKTYGFNKKSDRMSDGQLAAETGLSRQNVNKAKRELLAMGVLFLDGHKLGVNKQYEQWDFTARPEKDNLKQTRDSVSKSETKSVSKNGSHKRQKDTNSTDVELGAPKQSRNGLDFSEFTSDIDEQALRDFAKHRKALRKPLTQRALRSIVKLAKQCQEQIGITPEDALDVAMASGWLKVEPEWLINSGYAKHGEKSQANAPACPHADILAIWDETCGPIKGKAPNLLDWKGTKAAEALAERWAEFFAEDGSGRYSDTDGGLSWWRLALSTIAGKQDFRSADISVWDVFYKTRFSRAANGKLCGQGGATR